MFDAFALPFFWTALVASVVLAGIHTYLGYHVVRRGVIFVDLALAQMAALGFAFAVLFRMDEHPVASYLLPLGMTVLGALCFSWLRKHARNAPLEAYIGIVFATAQALVFLILEKTPSGTEHLKESLFGSLFTVAPRQIAVTAVLCALVGVVHFLARKGLFEVTEDPRGAKRRGRNIFGWDFLFYGTFGLVVTSAVKIAGILLVFGWLVIPAVSSFMATRGIRRSLIHGWGFGFVASLVGLVASVHFDTPAAPSILVSLTTLLVIEGIVLAVVRRASGGRNGAGLGEEALSEEAREVEFAGH